MLCPTAFPSSAPDRFFLLVHASQFSSTSCITLQLSSLLSLLRCGSPVDCRPFRVVPTPFWYDSRPKTASPAATSCRFLSAICLSRVPCAALIGYTLACSFKVWGFVPLLLKQVSETAAVVCISPPTQVTTAAPCSLNLIASALYMYTHNNKLIITASFGQKNRLS